MSNFREETIKWRREEMTAKDYEDVEKVIGNDALLETAALCLAIEEGNCQADSFPARVKEILETPALHLEAALYLTYNKSVSLEKGMALFKRLQKEKSFEASIPAGLTITK